MGLRWFPQIREIYLVSVSYWTDLNQLCPNAILVQSPGVGLGPTNLLNFFKDVGDIGVLCCLP